MKRIHELVTFDLAINNLKCLMLLALCMHSNLLLFVVNHDVLYCMITQLSLYFEVVFLWIMESIILYLEDIHSQFNSWHHPLDSKSRSFLKVSAERASIKSTIPNYFRSIDMAIFLFYISSNGNNRYNNPRMRTHSKYSN